MSRFLRGHSRGQSLVEFAICLPILLALILPAVDVGRWFYADITLTQAARDGARALALSSPDGGGPGTEPACVAIQNAAQNLSTTISCPGDATTPSGNTISVELTCPSDPNGCATDGDGTPAGQEVGVRLSYAFQPITPVSLVDLHLPSMTAHATMVASW